MVVIIIYCFVLNESQHEDRATNKCCEPLQKIRVKLGACKIDLSHPSFSSKAILLLWFYLFYVLESIFCGVCTLCTLSYFPLSLGYCMDAYW